MKRWLPSLSLWAALAVWLCATVGPTIAQLAVSSPAILGCSATIGTTPVQVCGAKQRSLLAIDNESTAPPSANIACTFGTTFTATLNAPGSYTIPAGFTRTWPGPKIPSDAVYCVSDTVSTPVTIEE